MHVVLMKIYGTEFYFKGAELYGYCSASAHPLALCYVALLCRLHCYVARLALDDWSERHFSCFTRHNTRNTSNM